MTIQLQIGLDRPAYVTVFVVDAGGHAIFTSANNPVFGMTKGSVLTLKAPNIRAGYGYGVITYQSDNVATVISSTVTDVGIGDVFIIAGQSNAANADQVNTSTQTGNVKTYNPISNTWSNSADPQPEVYPFNGPNAADNTHNFGATGLQGSLWPRFGDHLFNQNGGIPIGLFAVAYGGSAITDWIPAVSPGACDAAIWGNGAVYQAPGVLIDFGDGPLLRNACHHLPYLIDMARAAIAVSGGYRFFLWQQGEYEASANAPAITANAYHDWFRAMQQAVAVAVHPSRWVVAQDSFFPLDYFYQATTPCNATYANQSNSTAVAGGQRELVMDGSVYAGPNADLYIGDPYRYRGLGLSGSAGFCVHMSAEGQRVLSLEWAKAVVAIQDFAPVLAP